MNTIQDPHQYLSVKAFIFKDDRMLVLVRKIEEANGERSFVKRIDIPGGRVNFSEDPVDAIQRTAFEESGIKIDPLMPFNTWSKTKGDSQNIGMEYICNYLSGEVRLGEEHENFLWLTREEIEELDVSYAGEYKKAFELRDFLKQSYKI